MHMKDKKPGKIHVGFFQAAHFSKFWKILVQVVYRMQYLCNIRRYWIILTILNTKMQGKGFDYTVRCKFDS